MPASKYTSKVHQILTNDTFRGLYRSTIFYSTATLCGSTFSQASYRCPNCPYIGPSTSDIKRHSLIHSGERPFKCHHCCALFKQSNHLKNHLLTHSGEKVRLLSFSRLDARALSVRLFVSVLFVCLVCLSCVCLICLSFSIFFPIIPLSPALSFLYFVSPASSLSPSPSGFLPPILLSPIRPTLLSSRCLSSLHVTVNRCLPSLQAYKCSQCGKGASTPSNLKRHMLTHRERLKCVQCAYSTTDPAHLKQHQLTHGTFKCGICQFSTNEV